MSIHDLRGAKACTSIGPIIIHFRHRKRMHVQSAEHFSPCSPGNDGIAQTTASYQSGSIASLEDSTFHYVRISKQINRHMLWLLGCKHISNRGIHNILNRQHDMLNPLHSTKQRSVKRRPKMLPVPYLRLLPHTVRTVGNLWLMHQILLDGTADIVRDQFRRGQTAKRVGYSRVRCPIRGPTPDNLRLC
jgi:hypothetical protein